MQFFSLHKIKTLLLAKIEQQQQWSLTQPHSFRYPLGNDGAFPPRQQVVNPFVFVLLHEGLDGGGRYLGKRRLVGPLVGALRWFRYFLSDRRVVWILLLWGNNRTTARFNFEQNRFTTGLWGCWGGFVADDKVFDENYFVTSFFLLPGLLRLFWVSNTFYLSHSFVRGLFKRLKSYKVIRAYVHRFKDALKLSTEFLRLEDSLVYASRKVRDFITKIIILS